MMLPMPPTITEVLRFEPLAVDELGSRRAIVRWSDGTIGEALRWYDDLCGRPHKSSYAELGVMPRMHLRCWIAAEIGPNCSA